ncbi:MAG TPA: hypothetical protein VGI96_27370 [Streptosporangiaceae bacterium]
MAVMVLLLVVPRTRTGWPFVTALAEAGLDRFSYVVDDVSLMVTFTLPAVVTVKPDLDVLLTVPVVPPGSGPDRALEPLADPKWAATSLLAADEPLEADEPLPEVALTIP